MGFGLNVCVVPLAVAIPVFLSDYRRIRKDPEVKIRRVINKEGNLSRFSNWGIVSYMEVFILRPSP
jgi:hypothetical protein